MYLLSRATRLLWLTLSAVLIFGTSAPADADAESDGVGAEEKAKAWQLGAHMGSILPRGDLSPGVMAGIDFNMAVGPPRLNLVTGLDWSHLQNQSSELVAPTQYPRARVDLLQSSQLISLYAGATYDLLSVGKIRLFAGGIAGVNINRSNFKAVGMSVPENDVHGLVGVMAGATGPLGPVAWRVELGWREMASDLGDSGDFGESTMSGLVVNAGFGFASRPRGTSD